MKEANTSQRWSSSRTSEVSRCQPCTQLPLRESFAELREHLALQVGVSMLAAKASERYFSFSVSSRRLSFSESMGFTI